MKITLKKVREDYDINGSTIYNIKKNIVGSKNVII